jgi:hypothetical protein
MEGEHLMCLSIQSDPKPRLVGLRMDEAAHVSLFHREPLTHHITVIGDELDMEMSRQCLEALDQET